VRFFRSVPFSGASVIAVLAFGILSGFLFLNTLYLQDGRGYSALHAGLLTLPMAAMIFFFAPVSGRLVGSKGPRLPLVLAGIAGAVSLGLLSQLSDTSSLGYLLVCYVLLGLSMGMVNAPISNTAVSGMPNSQAGVAASVASASRQTGSALGVAITGSIVAGAAYPELAAASHGAWVLLAACSVAIIVIGYASTSRRAVATAERARGSDARGSDARGSDARGSDARGMLNGNAPGAAPASRDTGDPTGPAASAGRGPEKEGAAP
jgi:MFS family permease